MNLAVNFFTFIYFLSADESFDLRTHLTSVISDADVSTFKLVPSGIDKVFWIVSFQLLLFYMSPALRLTSNAFFSISHFSLRRHNRVLAALYELISV